MENRGEPDSGYLLMYCVVLALVVLLSALLVYIFWHIEGNTTGDVAKLLSEYNVPLEVKQCTKDYEGYVCQADANILLPDKNTDVEFIATAQVFITQEDNALYIVKVTPGFDAGHLFKQEIPENIKEVLKAITLVVSDKMYCLTASEREYRCYIPTNIAPMGNATLYYAPLFEIEIDNNTVKRVVVHV